MILDHVSFDKIVDNLHDGLYIVDRNRVIQYWNKAAEKISGFTAGEVIGNSCADNILTHVNGNGNSLCKGICPLARAISNGEPQEAEIFLHHKNGHQIPVLVRTSALTDSDDKIIGGIELFTDMTNIQSIELRIKELEDMAYIDNLTRLANRVYIEKELFIRLEEKKRLGVPFGIIFIDIDHFKSVNDTYGHDIGDRLLKFVADTLAKNARPFDAFGRWGGEEFIGIIRNVTPQQLEDMGDRLRKLVESSYIILPEGDKLNVRISIGATLVRDNETADTLFKRVDRLLYESKNAGRNRLTIG